MDRAQYNTCMKPFISGTGKTQEERRLSFCTGAKVCSGKTASVEEARQICLTEPPKPPKPRGSRRKKCELDPNALADCIIANAGTEFTAETLANAIAGCSGQKVKKSQRVTAADVAQMNPDYQEAMNAIASLKMDMGT